jgi:prephenate dehydrogenase
MAVQITIIGLGQIGASLGLALKEHTRLAARAGYDKDLSIARRAERLGALDRVHINLPNAVSQADLVLLCLPIGEVREVFRLIAPDLKPEAVVMDTAPVKGVVAGWAKELLPESTHYVGLVPVVNPAYLHSPDYGLDAAHEDLFKDTPMLIGTPPNTASAAIKLAADLTRLLGATPLFAELVELDSLMAATHILPQLLAAALINATIDQPGWREGRKLAGRPYAEVSGPITHMGSPEGLADSALLNRENVLRTVDGYLAALQAIRADIAEQNRAAISERLRRAHEGRQRWWSQRLAADWSNEQTPSAPELPSASEMFGRLLGLGKKRSG